MRSILVLALGLIAGCAGAGPPPATRAVYSASYDFEGVRVVSVERPAAESIHLALYLQPPAPFEGRDRDAAHVLEHLILRSPSLKSPSLAALFDGAGGSIHGRTTRGWIALHGHGFDPWLARGLLAAARNPAIDDASLAKEIRIVSIETGRRIDVTRTDLVRVRDRLASVPPVLVVVSDDPLEFAPQSAPRAPRLAGVRRPPADAERWRDLDLLAADLGAAAIDGNPLRLLQPWGEVRDVGSGAHVWVVATDHGPPSDPLAPSAVPVSPRAGPHVILRRPVHRNPEGERKALARELYRVLVLDRGIAYGPSVRVEDGALVATIWTDAEGIAECEAALAGWGEVVSSQGLAPRNPDW